MTEFPESLVSDSKCRDSRLKTRNRTRFGLDISVFPVSDSESESKLQDIAHIKGVFISIYGFFKGKKENQTRNSETLGSGLGIGLGIGIATSICRVSDSESDSSF